MKKLIFLGAGLFTVVLTASLGLLFWGMIQLIPSPETIEGIAKRAKTEASSMIDQGQKIATEKSKLLDEPCRRAMGVAAGRFVAADVLHAWDSVEALYAHCWKGELRPLKSSDRPT